MNNDFGYDKAQIRTNDDMGEEQRKIKVEHSQSPLCPKMFQAGLRLL